MKIGKKVPEKNAGLRWAVFVGLLANLVVGGQIGRFFPKSIDSRWPCSI